MGYYTARAQELLSAARPLMDIYRIDNKNEFNAFLQVDSEAIGKRRSILSSLPLYTIDASLLVEMLARSGFDGEEAAGIADAASSARRRVVHILETSEIHVEIPLLTREEFEVYPLNLDLSNVFARRASRTRTSSTLRTWRIPTVSQRIILGIR